MELKITEIITKDSKIYKVDLVSNIHNKIQKI
jgi:hypothetical protein